jgi:DNA-binding Lrp family transcriptional regulator
MSKHAVHLRNRDGRAPLFARQRALKTSPPSRAHQRALAKTLGGFHDRPDMDAIIDLLQKNALMPRDEMARLLNMTTAEVEAAIAKLEADGIILGYQPVLNREKWDTDKVTAVIEVKITPERDGGFDRIASRIARFPEVQSCYLVSGGYDLLILVEAPNLRAAAAFVAERLSTIDAVQSTATHFRLKTYKENGTFHTFEASSERLSVTP